MLSKRMLLLSFIPGLGSMTCASAAYAGNVAPTIAGSPRTAVTAGRYYSFTPMSSDANDDKLTFGVGGLPRWAGFNRRTGQLYGRPGAGDVGKSRPIAIAVSDGRLTRTLASFTITVRAATSVNAAPTISGSPPASATAASDYFFRPTAADPEGAVLTFSVLNKPVWATFDKATGRLRGTPAATDVGTYSNVTVRVTDGTNTTSLPPFSITVSDAATVGAATLSWQPPTEYVDGLPLQDLAGFKIRYGTAADNLDQLVTIANPGITSAMIESLAAGTWYFAVNAYTLANVESNLSNVVQKTIL
jgi:hypothetical protein